MITDIKSIPFENVLSVYSGKARACCCGCAGKHTYVSAHREEASKRRGYPVEDSEVSDGAAKRVFNLIVNDPDVQYDEQYQYIWTESDTRLKIAYLK